MRGGIKGRITKSFSPFVTLDFSSLYFRRQIDFDIWIDLVS
jgi:hypothetical protein